MTPPNGRLKVSIPAIDPAIVRPTVNLIDADTLALVRTAVCDEEVTLPAGKYLLTSLLPTGERSFGMTEVTAGGLAEAELIEVEEPTVEAVQSTVEEAGDSPAEIESLGVPTAESPAHEASQEKEWYVRWLVLEGGQARPATDLSIDPPSAAAESGDVELVVRAPPIEGVLFAQLARQNEVPLNVALPINGKTSSTTCRLTVSNTTSLNAFVSLPDSAREDAVARYLQSGALQQAANLAADAEELLRDKEQDPFAAALGGYALIRLHQLERLGDWAQNLAAWFPWLPDGAIVAGEQSALLGDHVRALGYFCEAARRGLPAYADGFSMLASRLREYGNADDAPPGASRKLVVEAAGHARRLVPLAPMVDFARIMLALPGARLDDLAGSQEPIADPVEAEGWDRFPAAAVGSEGRS